MNKTLIVTFLSTAAFVVGCNKEQTTAQQMDSTVGDAMTVTWTVNGVNVQTNQVPEGSTTNVAVVLAADLELGTNIVVVTTAGSSGGETSCESTIIVQDTVAPVITSATSYPTTLWPPNHKLVPVSIAVATVEACCVADWKIVSVTSNEAVASGSGKDKVKGAGKTDPDWIITGNQGLSLRAERAGSGSGRVYTITVQAQDCAGNVSEPATLTVTVPHDQGKKNK